MKARRQGRGFVRIKHPSAHGKNWLVIVIAIICNFN